MRVIISSYLRIIQGDLGTIGQTASTIGVDASTGRSRISCDRAVDQAPLAAEVNTAAAICGTVFCSLLAGKMLRQESHE
jgi:hypothetical protein